MMFGDHQEQAFTINLSQLIFLIGGQLVQSGHIPLPL
jgi:hypothetical protein